MANLRARLVLSSATGCFLLTALVVTVQIQQMPAPDPERGFAFGDTDLDGRLSLEEFRELIRNVPRLKKAAAKKASLPLEPVLRDQDPARPDAEAGSDVRPTVRKFLIS
jgi:hypothetical protein